MRRSGWSVVNPAAGTRRFAVAAGLVLLFLLMAVPATPGESFSAGAQSAAAPVKPGTDVPQEHERSRDKGERPDEIIRLIEVQPGMRIGEVGAGSGYFTFFLAAKVGESGVVYANDINGDALAALERNMKKAGGAKHIIPVLGAEDDPRFPARDLDMIVAYCSFHDIKNRDVWLSNAVAYLKPNATIAIIDGYWPEHGGLTLEKLRDYGARVGFQLRLHADFTFPVGGEVRSHHVHLFDRRRATRVAGAEGQHGMLGVRAPAR